MQYCLYMAIFLSAMYVIIARYETRHLFIQLETLASMNDELDEEWGRLQLEYSTWATDGRIESEARSNLDMEMPRHSDMVLVRQ